MGMNEGTFSPQSLIVVNKDYRMCRCCSVTQQKCWVFGLGTVFVVIGIICIVWWPDWITEEIYKSLPLSPCSLTYEKWAITPIPVYMYMYLFNWTNALEVGTVGVKPNFQKLGPYVFEEVKTKEDITWHSDKTVTFKGNRTWFFQADMSGGKLDDLVTMPHLPSIAASNFIRDEIILIKVVFNNALNNNGGALYHTHTAIEWLFDGFYDEFLDYAMKMNNSMTSNIQDNHFAWFLNRNGSKEFEGTFNIHTGQGDLRQMGELKHWNGMNHTGFYEGDCGRINGSTADLFVPNRTPDEFITVYIADTCRIINLEPTHEKVIIEGIEGYKYETKPNTYDNGQLNDDMKCYCPKVKQPNNCPKTGVTDLGPCAEGAPMFLSHANFMYADASYRNTTTGLNPNYEEDNFFIIMERKLGIPLQVNAAVQVSLLMQQDKDITILRNIPNFYAPLFITASRARVDQKLAKEIKLALYLPHLGRDIGIALTSIGGAMIIVGIVLTLTRNWCYQRRNDVLEERLEESG